MANFEEEKISLADFLDKDIASIEGNTVAGQAEWLKARFDSAAKNVVMPKLNALIDDLQAATAANQIGNTALTVSSGTTVGAQLRYILEQLNAVVLNQIPDNSIGDNKLSTAAGQILARAASLDTTKASLTSPSFIGTPTVPTAAGGTNTTQIASTAYVRNELSPVNTHMESTNIHVTAEQKANWILKDGSVSMTGALTLPGAPTEELHAATKKYVDDKQETGTWDPTIYGSSTAGTPSYVSSTEGTYIKTGKLIFITMHIRITAKGGLAGNVRVGGLPFTPNVSTQNLMTAAALTLTNAVGIYAHTSESQTYLDLGFETCTSGALTYVLMTDAQLGNTADIYGSFTYQIA